MLTAYKAKLVNNQIQWLDEKPTSANADIIVTVLSEAQDVATALDLPQTTLPKRQAPESLQGLAVIHGDIINVPEMTTAWEME